VLLSKGDKRVGGGRRGRGERRGGEQRRDVRMAAMSNHTTEVEVGNGLVWSLLIQSVMIR
jgi:hypothetical protein